MIQYNLSFLNRNPKMNNINDFKEAVNNSEKIIIMPHVNPDGDTISSALALNLILETYFNKPSKLVVIGKMPEVYEFLPHVDRFININEINSAEVFDLAIAVDIASKDRLSEGFNIFNNAKLTINIDHHKTNNNYGIINFVNSKASSAGEVLFNITKELGFKLDKDISTCLYTSILTDTGGFKYENTTAKTLIIASELIENGADPCKIYRACYESKPQAMVELQSYALSNAVFSDDGKIAYTIITLEDMQKFKASDDYTDGISEVLRQIKTVEISFVLKETTLGQTKISLRSKNVDVSEISAIFGGGGHKFAAGCTIKKPPAVALNKLLDSIRKELYEKIS